MIASLGGGASITDSRKDCQINLDLHYPQGFTYSVFNTEFRGYADIPAGFKGVQRADYYFSGSMYTSKKWTMSLSVYFLADNTLNQ
jgi:hypothetical protein